MTGYTFGRSFLFSSLPLCKSCKTWDYDKRSIAAAIYHVDTGRPPIARTPKEAAGYGQGPYKGYCIWPGLPIRVVAHDQAAYRSGRLW
ncbi:hypothetical protein B296_00031768 [Ensete ventricosum]|uniref:Uncharacterized protein n=1 Tax=Ensete ventricosum TaxID=4639 RepID=A0A426ZDF5_ENSVE|nr:hypothetical protein B296_00031768 [Ensete ventricosum]